MYNIFIILIESKLRLGSILYKYKNGVDLNESETKNTGC